MHIVAKRATTEGDMGGTAMGHRPSAFRAFLLAPIAFAISPSLAHAHGAVTSNADSLRVLLSEWSLEIDAIRVGAGIVRVRAVNVGTLRHNLTVTKARSEEHTSELQALMLI